MPDVVVLGAARGRREGFVGGGKGGEAGGVWGGGGVWMVGLCLGVVGTLDLGLGGGLGDAEGGVGIRSLGRGCAEGAVWEKAEEWTEERLTRECHFFGVDVGGVGWGLG